MIKLGIRLHDIGQFSFREHKDLYKSYGFSGLQLVPNKAFKEGLSSLESSDFIHSFPFEDVWMLGAYFNMIHPDRDIKQNGMTHFKKMLKFANTYKIPYVGTETGSKMGSPWGYDPKNHTKESYDEVVDVLKELLRFTDDLETQIAIEGAYAHTIYAPKVMRRLLDDLKNPHLKVTLDLFNLLNLDQFHDYKSIWLEALSLLKEDIVIIHLKDFVIENDQFKLVGLGKGLFDYPWLIQTLFTHLKNPYLIFEGVVSDNTIKESVMYIKSLIRKENI
jgi:L-ribulose-5-phosphate 3-epimerase